MVTKLGQGAIPSHWLVQVNPFYEHSSAGGERKLKGELKLKRKGKEGVGWGGDKSSWHPPALP